VLLNRFAEIAEQEGMAVGFIEAPESGDFRSLLVNRLRKTVTTRNTTATATATATSAAVARRLATTSWRLRTWSVEGMSAWASFSVGGEGFTG